MLSWLKGAVHDREVQDVPKALARCEFECRVGECSYGKWEQCERRILYAKQLEQDEPVSDVKSASDALSSLGDSFPQRQAGLRETTIASDNNAVTRTVAGLWHRGWPPTALVVALIVNLAWIGFLGYQLAKLLGV